MLTTALDHVDELTVNLTTKNPIYVYVCDQAFGFGVCFTFVRVFTSSMIPL